MSLSENYQCDVCGTKKTDKEQWWLMSMGCVPGASGGTDQPLLKLGRWETRQAHEPGGAASLRGALRRDDDGSVDDGTA